VTGTVASIDLIVSSILSKKLAGGAGVLVFDVKLGSGAFLPDVAAARELASALVSTARGAGVAAGALLTDMNQPVAPAIGNAVEIRAVLEVLEGGGSPLADLTVALGAECLARAGTDADVAGGAARLREALASGRAMERWRKMVALMGGDPDAPLPEAPVVRPAPSPGAGQVAAIDGTALGLAVVRLGGGRQREGDRVNPAVGLTQVARLGQAVEEGAPLAYVHASDAAAAEAAVQAVGAAFQIGVAAEAPPLIHERME
jgi:thymidine phosphorylase